MVHPTGARFALQSAWLLADEGASRCHTKLHLKTSPHFEPPVAVQDELGYKLMAKRVFSPRMLGKCWKAGILQRFCPASVWSPDSPDLVSHQERRMACSVVAAPAMLVCVSVLV